MQRLLTVMLLAAFVAMAPRGEAGALERSLGDMQVPRTPGLDLQLLRMMPPPAKPPMRRYYKPVNPVVSYCRADCTYCRDACYWRWRIHCEGYGCRQEFTFCMRHCWEQICRLCRR